MIILLASLVCLSVARQHHHRSVNGCFRLIILYKKGRVAETLKTSRFSSV